MMRQTCLLWLGLAFMGCATSPEDTFVGVWTAQSDGLEVPAVGAPVVQRRLKRTLGEMLIKLRPDRTFTLNMGASLNGTWSYQNGEIILKPNAATPDSIRGLIGDAPKVKATPGDTTVIWTTETFVGPVRIPLKKTG